MVMINIDTNIDTDDYQYHREYNCTETINYIDKDGRKVTKNITTHTTITKSIIVKRE